MQFGLHPLGIRVHVLHFSVAAPFQLEDFPKAVQQEPDWAAGLAQTPDLPQTVS